MNEFNTHYSIPRSEANKIFATALRRCYYQAPWQLPLPGLNKRFIFSLSQKEGETSSSPYWRLWRICHDTYNLKPYRMTPVERRPMGYKVSPKHGNGNFVAIYDWSFTLYSQDESGYYSIDMTPLATSFLEQNVSQTIMFRPDYILNDGYPSRKPIEAEKVFDKLLNFRKEYNGTLLLRIVEEANNRIDVYNLIPIKG